MPSSGCYVIGDDNEFISNNTMTNVGKNIQRLKLLLTVLEP
jgi:hypothetical protein